MALLAVGRTIDKNCSRVVTIENLGLTEESWEDFVLLQGWRQHSNLSAQVWMTGVQGSELFCSGFKFEPDLTGRVGGF